jgi:hypothetical protein
MPLLWFCATFAQNQISRMRSGEAYCYSEFMTVLATDCEHCRSHYNFVNLYDDDEYALSEEEYCDVASHSIAFKCSPR